MEVKGEVKMDITPPFPFFTLLLITPLPLGGSGWVFYLILIVPCVWVPAGVVVVPVDAPELF